MRVYLKAFGFMYKAINSKSTELLISLLMVITLLFLSSGLMYQLEHKAQPEAFSSIPATMWWGVATLTTVGYGDIYPITAIGKLLGGIIAILGVGLFALPAGIIAAGFIEEIEKEKKKRFLEELEGKLKHAFFVEYFAPVIKKKDSLGLSHLPRKWLGLNDIKYKMGISEAMVLEVVEYSKLFRLRNVKINGIDYAGLEIIDLNRAYGTCVDRKSKLTVVNLYPSVQPYFGHFSMALADILQANYISNEVYSKLSFLQEKQLNLINNEDYERSTSSHTALAELKADLKSLIGQESVCLFMVNAGSNENLLQFNLGGEVGDESFEQGPFFADKQKLNQVFESAASMAEGHELQVLKHGSVGKPASDHVTWFIHRETQCDLLMLHVNVGILKKKGPVYYQYLDDFGKVFAGLK